MNSSNKFNSSSFRHKGSSFYLKINDNTFVKYTKVQFTGLFFNDTTCLLCNELGNNSQISHSLMTRAKHVNDVHYPVISTVGINSLRYRNVKSKCFDFFENK